MYHQFKLLAKSALLLLLAVALPLHAAKIWHPLNEGLVGTPAMSALAINNDQPDQLYAGVQFGGLYKSNDDAHSWVALAPAIFSAQPISVIAINPKNAAEIFVGTCGKGVYKSVDNGKSWNQINNRMKSQACITSLQINPINPQQLTAVDSNNNTLYQSQDSGKHWTVISHPKSDLGLLALDLVKPNILLLNADHGIYKSQDIGAHWSLVSGAAFDPEFGLGFASYSSLIAYGAATSGFYKSEDAGDTWQLLFAPANSADAVTSYLLDKMRSAQIYISVYNEGLYQSIDTGKNWTLLNSQVGKSDFVNLLLNPHDAQEMYLISNTDGLMKSLDGGFHFISASNGIMSFKIKSLAASVDGSTLFAGTYQNGLWIKQGALPWQLVSAAFLHSTIIDMVVNPVTPTNLVIISENADHTQELLVSHDTGATWQPAVLQYNLRAGDVDFTCLAINPMNPQELFAGSDNILWKSSDGGLTWSQLFAADDKLSSIQSIIFNPANPLEMYLGTVNVSKQVLYKSIDGGKSWVQLNYVFGGDAVTNNFTFTRALAIDPVNVNTLYAAVLADKLELYKSIDGGANWTIIGKGLPQVSSYSAIVIDPKNPNIVYVTIGDYIDDETMASGNGVYISFDGGMHFSAINNGLENRLITTLLYHHAKLYAGTAGSGVYTADAVT